MRTKVGTFTYPIDIGDARGESFEEVRPWVDTGALYSQFPASLLERLGHRPNARRQFRLADGTISEGPIGPVALRIRGEVQPFICIFGDEGCMLLLGATTLETFSLAPDPVNETLNPTIAMLLSLIAVEDTNTLSLDFSKLAQSPAAGARVACAAAGA